MTYVVGSTVVDPGDVDGLIGIADVLLTHCHFDHIYGLNRLWETNRSIKVYTNECGRILLADSRKNLSKYHGEQFVFSHPENIVVVNDGDDIVLDCGLTATAVFTPGHNDSCITWIVGDFLFTGDAYIPGVPVVTNLPGADKAKAAESVGLISRLSLGSMVCPGHDATTKK